MGLEGYEYGCENADKDKDKDKEESPEHKSNPLEDTDEDDIIIAPVISDGRLKRLKKMKKSTSKGKNPQWDEDDICGYSIERLRF